MSNTLDDVAFITLTNSGYINYTLNCLKSLENINFNKKLKCFCIGKEGYNILKEKNYECKLINNEEHSKFEEFRQGDWANIILNKFVIIYEELQKNKFVCITDGDIVYENNNFLNYCLDNIKDNDMLIQNDSTDNNDKIRVCSGFMFIKSNEVTLNLFNPNKTEKNKNRKNWGDQHYVGSICKNNKLKYDVLPLELFPNGNYYFKEKKNINPYMIHFNWLIGHGKKKKMNQENKWFIN